MGKFIDLTGEHFGRVTVIKKAGRDKNGLILWLCLCTCGKKYITRGQDLRRGKSTNCGCRHAEVLHERNYRHGASGSRPYRIWKNMKTRCNNKNSSDYKNYGARGITVCDEWLNSFETFWRDMGPGYADDLEIDRIDNEKGYSAVNCRWVTDVTQSRNKRTNRIINIGQKKITLVEFAEKINRPYSRVKSQLNRGWRIDEIITGVRSND